MPFISSRVNFSEVSTYSKKKTKKIQIYILETNTSFFLSLIKCSWSLNSLLYENSLKVCIKTGCNNCFFMRAQIFTFMEENCNFWSPTLSLKVEDVNMELVYLLDIFTLILKRVTRVYQVFDQS